MDIVTILLILVGIACFAAIIVFNQLVRLRNTRTQSLADIDTQAKLRFDLIPNLVASVKGYAKHEASLLEQITKARTAAMGAQTLEEKASADAAIASGLKSLFAVAENYPDLKANTQFLHLQQELSSIEAKLAAARRFFNNATKEYNTLVMSFPHMIVAKLARFHEEPFFALSSEQERDVVSIDMSA